MFYPFFNSFMALLQRSLQYLTFSQVLRHFFRHENVLLHIMQFFLGRSCFFIDIKNENK